MPWSGIGWERGAALKMAQRLRASQSRGRHAPRRHVVCTTGRRTFATTTRRSMDARRKVELFLERPRRPGRAGATHKGSLVIIGGHEDRTGERKILRAVADRLGDDGKIVVCTVASTEPASIWEEYEA